MGHCSWTTESQGRFQAATHSHGGPAQLHPIYFAEERAAQIPGESNSRIHLVSWNLGPTDYFASSWLFSQKCCVTAHSNGTASQLIQFAIMLMSEISASYGSESNMSLELCLHNTQFQNLPEGKAY